MDLLLILRGLAALSVVFWHVTGAYHSELPAALNTSGRTAVWLFFGISGYVIAHGFIHGRYRLAPSHLAQFYWNRMLRLYPLFVTLSALAWVTMWWQTGASPIGVADIPSQFFALQYNQQYVLSGVFWTLGVEFHFYLLAPLLVLPLLSRHRLQPVLSMTVYGVTVVGYVFTVLRYGVDGRNIVANLPHFFIGMLACRLVASPPTISLPLWLSASAAVGIIALTNWLYHRAPTLYWSAVCCWSTWRFCCSSWLTPA